MTSIIQPRWAENMVPSVDHVAWILSGLAVVFFSLRLWARTRRSLWLWWDDYILIFALATLLGNAATITAYLRLTFEKDPSYHDFETYILVASLVGTFNSLCQGFSKTSVATTYWRLVGGWSRLSLAILLVSLDIMMVGQVFTYWMKDCRVPNEPYRMPGQCAAIGPVKAFRITAQAMSLLIDLYLTLLPWKIVWNLNMRKMEKAGLAFAMSLGCMALVAGVVRLILWVNLTTVEPNQIPYYGANILMWNFIEPALTIIAACVPVLRVFLMEHMPGTTRNRTRQSATVVVSRGASFHKRGRSGHASNDFSCDGGFDLEQGVHGKPNLHEWLVEARSFEPSATGDETRLIRGGGNANPRQNHITVGHSVSVVASTNPRRW